MTKEEFWKKFKDGVLCIHTPTEEECMAVAKTSKENGIYLGLDMAEYFEYGENTYLGVVKKDDLDIISRAMAASHFGKSIDCWLAYGTKEHVGHNQIIEFSEVFGDDVNKEESEPNIKAMLSCKLDEINNVMIKFSGEGEDILDCLSDICQLLVEVKTPIKLINEAVSKGIDNAEKRD